MSLEAYPIYYIAACLIGLLFLGLGLHRYFHYRPVRLFTPLVLFITGTLLSAMLLFLPSFAQGAKGVSRSTVLLALHRALRMFVLDFTPSEFIDSLCLPVAETTEALVGCPFFPVYVSLLAILAPVLTFGAVLSLFQDLQAYGNLAASFWREKYVFSQLNERSITLAEDLCRHDRRRKMIFTGVRGDLDDCQPELLTRAKKLRACCFRKEVTAILFAFAHAPFHRPMTFFAIHESSADNLATAAQLQRQYRYRPNTTLYLFSSSVESDMFVSTYDPREGELRLRRIHEARCLVYRMLYDMEAARSRGEVPAMDLFTTAAAVGPGQDKCVSAVLVGLGQYGTELLKALTWFCQMDGYRLKLRAFDRDPAAEDHLRASCPALLDESHNHNRREGEALYDLQIFPGTDVESQAFDAAIRRCADATYVFVALGSDEVNIASAVRLRKLFARMGKSPVIHAVVYSDEQAEALRNCTNFAGDAYDIVYKGCLRDVYSEKVIIGADMEEEAIAIHERYSGGIVPLSAEEKEALRRQLYAYEYNYYSSMASAIHRLARINCGMPSDQDALEHRRWNAYMRTEGYVYGPRKDHLAKTHPDLVPFDELTTAARAKDRRIADREAAEPASDFPAP